MAVNEVLLLTDAGEDKILLRMVGNDYAIALDDGSKSCCCAAGEIDTSCCGPTLIPSTLTLSITTTAGACEDNTVTMTWLESAAEWQGIVDCDLPALDEEWSLFCVGTQWFIKIPGVGDQDHELAQNSCSPFDLSGTVTIDPTTQLYCDVDNCTLTVTVTE